MRSESEGATNAQLNMINIDFLALFGAQGHYYSSIWIGKKKDIQLRIRSHAEVKLHSWMFSTSKVSWNTFNLWIDLALSVGGMICRRTTRSLDTGLVLTNFPRSIDIDICTRSGHGWDGFEIKAWITLSSHGTLWNDGMFAKDSILLYLPLKDSTDSTNHEFWHQTMTAIWFVSSPSTAGPRRV